MPRENKKKIPMVSAIVPTMDRIKDVSDCVDSILKSSYPNFEVIIVNNASSDDTKQELDKRFGRNKKVKIINSKINLGAGGGRNRGAKSAKGEYLLFVDDDNVVDSKMIKTLSSYMTKNNDCGLVGPLMKYKKHPKKIWLYFADINMTTSRAFYKGTAEKDRGQYEEIIQVGHIPNSFMIRKKDFKQINGFDEKYIVMYEEADLAEKVKKVLGKKVIINTAAITYHNVPLPSEIDQRDNGFRTPRRAFLTSRNRIYFMKHNANWLNFILFLVIFNPLLFIYYESILISRSEFRKAWAYFVGVLAGIVL
jgi:hypothetical protein